MKFYGGTWKGFYHHMAARIKEGSDPDTYGAFTILPATSPDTLQVLYRNPTYISIKDAMNSPSLFTAFRLELYFPTIQEGSNHVDYYDMNVYRPPVFMVHGLWGSKKAFDVMASSFVGTGFYKREFIHQADYSSTNTQYFRVNKIRVETQISDYLDLLTSPQSCVGVTKVDYVAHSMGGILGRLYLQSDTYKDNIYRIVTINTPHAGSQFANVLRSPLRIGDKDIACSLIPAGTEVPWGGGACDGGAVDDLRVDSDAIRIDLNGPTKNRRTVPSHAITTTADLLSVALSGQLSKQTLDNTLSYLQVWVLFVTMSNIFKGELNDHIVALSSQQGGTCTSNVDGQIHTRSPENPEVIRRTYSALIDKPTSSWFCANGFNPPTLFPPNLSFFSADTPLTQGTTTPSVQITAPAKGKIVQAGTPLTITVTGKNVDEMLTVVDFSRDSVYTGRTNGLTATYTIPTSTTSLGKKYIILGGRILSGTSVIDTVYFYVAGNCASIKSGNWNDKSVWSCGREPTVNDIVTVNTNHLIAVTTKTAYTKRIIYSGGKVQFAYAGTKLSAGLDYGVTEPPNSVSITNFSNPLTLLTYGSNARQTGNVVAFDYNATNGSQADFRATNPMSLTNGFESTFTFSATSGQRIYFRITNPANGSFSYIGLLLSATSTSGIASFSADGYGQTQAGTVFDGKVHTARVVMTNKANNAGSALSVYLDGPSSFYGFPLFDSYSTATLPSLFKTPMYVGIGAFDNPAGTGKFNIYSWTFKGY